MKRSRVDMKADLMHQAEVLVEELLDWNEQTAEPTLTQIEEVILKLRQRMSEQMGLAVIESQAATRPVPPPLCPTCQGEMHYKDMKDNTVESQIGQLTLTRGYYYCETCRAGLFPPGRAVAGVGQALERTSGQVRGVVERIDGV